MSNHEFEVMRQSSRFQTFGQRLLHFFARRLVAAPLLLLGVWFLPYFWCSREADAFFDGSAAVHQRLALGVADWTTREVNRLDFSTGSDRFDGEWLFGTYMMAAMGFGQMALEYPEWRVQHLRHMDQCLTRLLEDDIQQFSSSAWADRPLDTLDSDTQHHAAYLGYMNMALSLRRLIEPEFEHAELNDRITETLVRRIRQSESMLLLTYPHEAYPVDNSAVLASIALHARATGADHGDVVRSWVERCREQWIDPNTGLLFQSVDASTGMPLDEPRGSGSALAAHFLNFADAALAAELFQAIRQHLSGRICCFGMVKEYPATSPGGQGDIDSGPLIFGYSISATGFSMASARIHGDREFFRQLYATSYLFGAPTDRSDRRNYVSGGPLGDAILFAMLTVTPLPAAQEGQ